MTEQTLKGPYVSSDGKPVLKESVVAFIDVLGFNDTIKKASAEGKGQELLEDYHSAFLDSVSWLGIKTPSTPGPIGEFLQFKAVKIFSDNIVIGYPIYRDGEVEIGGIFDELAWFQMYMSQRGYFVRGAITVGDIYIDDFTIFGDVLLEAVEAEKTFAVFPRIILTDKAEALVKTHLSNYHLGPGWCPHNNYLFRDADGKLFLNYLESVLIAEDEHGPFLAEVMKHRDVTIQRLHERANNSAIFEKYAWTARYHNFFCSEYRNFGEEYLIPQTELDRPFSRLEVTPVTSP